MALQRLSSKWSGITPNIINRIEKRGMVALRAREQLTFEWTGGAMNARIVVVEDDVDQLTNYSYALQKKGFQVSSYETLEEVHLHLSQTPSLALLDVHLGHDPDAGFGLCQWLLDRYPGLPVIFLTSRHEEIDQIFGLRLGAWDYLTKPISTALLVEKVAAVLKRVNDARRPGVEDLLEAGPLLIDVAKAKVFWRDLPVTLTVTELSILEALVRADGAVLSFDQLAERTRQSVVTNNTLSTHIKHIRQKIKRLDPTFDALVSVYGSGYQWDLPPE